MLREWIEGYIRAWDSNDPEQIGALFTDGAVYFTEPWAEPWRGREGIVAGWLENRDEPGDATFEWEPLVETADVSLITGTTVYREPPRTYSNIWVIRLEPDGRCREFVEWYMQQPVDS